MKDCFFPPPDDPRYTEMNRDSKGRTPMEGYNAIVRHEKRAKEKITRVEKTDYYYVAKSMKYVYGDGKGGSDPKSVLRSK